MRMSMNWLKEYVNLDGVTPEVLAEKLTIAGLEVEGIEKMAEGTNLVIGQVLTCENHPDSDHLHVTTVNVGDEVLNIVCGAPNVQAGQKVIVSKVGAVLAGGFEIKPAKVRGVEAEISAPDSKVKVWVIPTNEELAIARDTLALTSK